MTSCCRTGRAVAEELPTKPSLSHLQIVFDDGTIEFKVEDMDANVVNTVKPGGTYTAEVSTWAVGESGTSLGAYPRGLEAMLSWLPIYVCVRACVCVCMCVYICVYKCEHVCRM